MLLVAPSPLAVSRYARSRAPAIRIERLTKRFAVQRRWVELLRNPGERRHTMALDAVSLTANEGEIVGLLGPNGAGKTTLLKIASTLVLPDAGSVEIGGVDVVRSPGLARGIVSPVSADERSLEWRLSARENLRFYGALHGLAGAALHSRIDELLHTMQLADAGERRVATYSSGMKQRLLIARGLLPAPRVLLLDEPTRSLDPLAARAFRDLLRSEIAGRQGCTILMATHDPDEAMDLCDRIAILDHGRVEALGTARDLMRAFGEERYRLWLRADISPRDLSAAVAGIQLRPELDNDGWTVGDIELAPGQNAIDVLAALVGRGAPVGRFEKIQPTVADMMERVLARRPREGNA